MCYRSLWFKVVELSKEGILVPGSALNCIRSVIKHTYDQAYNDAFERACACAQEPRSSALCSSARSMIECTPHQPHILCCPSRHCFMPCTAGILSGYVRSSAPSCDRAHKGCARVHWLRSSAPLTWQHIKFCL